MSKEPSNITIALVSNTSWSVYNFRLGFIQYLQSLGVNVVVIAPRDNFSAKLVSLGIEYREVRIRNYGTNPFDDLNLVYRLNKIYRSVKPDFVFHYTIKPNIFGSFAAFSCKIPSIIITTGLGHLFDFKNIFIRLTSITLYRIAAFLSKEVWFLNDNDRDVFIYKRIVSKKKTRLLRSEGINTAWFTPRKEKRFSASPRFLFAGRLIWDKGVNEYVEAARIIKAKFPKAKFELLGFIDEGNPNSVPYETIRKWQKEKVINYLGETTDIRSFLERANCLVFPSFYREGVSRVLMEAASMETPIITTDNVGCRDIVDDGKNGFLCEPKNVESLVDAIESFILLDDQDKLVMGKLGRKKMIKEFDEQKVIDAYKASLSKYVQLPQVSTYKVESQL